MKRPISVTIIAWLAIVGGALQILGSLGFVGIEAFQLTLLTGSTGALGTAMLLGQGMPFWLGGGLIVLGAVGILFGIGALAKRAWSWTLGIVLYVLNLVAALALLLVVGFGLTLAGAAVISAVVLGYLYTGEVREALGHPVGGISSQTPHAV
jgi:hypothetical protein